MAFQYRNYIALVGSTVIHYVIMKIFERKTIVSEAVLDIIQTHHGPLSSPQIVEALHKKGLTPNPSTVYRILEKLKSKNIIRDSVFKNGVTYYEHTDHHHHHHFICTKCDHITCLEGCHVDKLKMDLTSLLPSPTFKITGHEFTIYGQCEGCETTHVEKVVAC